MSVKIVPEEELCMELKELPTKLKYRLMAKASGWRIPNHIVLDFNLNDNSMNFEHELVDLNLPSRFTTDQVHVLILPKPTQNMSGKTRRWFQMTTAINELLMDLSKSGPLRVLITEVIPPLLSGVSSWQNGESIIEVAYGQMIAKGNVETSYYQFYENALVNKQENVQRWLNEIKNGEIITRELNKRPHLEPNQLEDILRNTRVMIQLASKPLTIEWFLKASGEIIYLDAMEEQSISFHDVERINHNNQSVNLEIANPINPKVNSPNGTGHNRRLHAKNPIIISPGTTRGKIQKIESPKNSNETLNLHFQDFTNANIGLNGSVEKTIYCCDSPKLEYVPLIESAAGFIFSYGGCLSHLANLIRAHRIPACIDAALCQYAPTIAETVYFHCGDNKSSRDLISEDKLLNYQKKLVASPILSPVLSIQKNFIAESLGWKALNLNLLKVAGFNVPDSVFLPWEITTRLELKRFLEPQTQLHVLCGGHFRAKNLIEIIRKIFPRFEGDPDCRLICRSSSNLEDGFRESAAGIFESIPDIRNYSQLLAAIARRLLYFTTRCS